MIHTNNAQASLFSPGPAGTWRSAVPADDPPARRDGPDTSKAAARAMRPGAKSIQSRVLAYFIAQGDRGATNEEAGDALGLKQQTITARTNKLAKLGLVRDSGNRRPTASGRKAIVWTATRGREVTA